MGNTERQGAEYKSVVAGLCLMLKSPDDRETDIRKLAQLALTKIVLFSSANRKLDSGADVDDYDAPFGTLPQLCTLLRLMLRSEGNFLYVAMMLRVRMEDTATRSESGLPALQAKPQAPVP
eukprot:g48841.t1